MRSFSLFPPLLTLFSGFFCDSFALSGSPCHGVFEDEELFGKRWKETFSARKFVWAEQTERICNKSALECLNVDKTAAVLQFSPVILQLGQKIEIEFPKTSNAVAMVKTVEEFESCNTTSGTKLLRRMWPINAPTEPGEIYLLEMSGNCTKKGRRLKITWSSHKCKSSNGSKELCNGEGVCVLPRNKETYQCLCCDGTMVDDGLCRKPVSKTPDNGARMDPLALTNCTCSQASPECCTEISLSPGNPCASQPCQNGGICRITATVAQYICLCDRDYSGPHCEKKAKKSCGPPNPCPFRSRCFVNDNTIECIPDTLIGNLNECVPNPCRNHAMCYFVRGIPRCFCHSTHIGVLCQDMQEPISIFSSDNHGGSIFVVLATLVCAILVVAVILVTFQCQLWTCYFLPRSKKRRSYNSWAYDPAPSPCFSGIGSARSASEHSKLQVSDSVPTMYTAVDDFPMTSIQSFQASASHFESEHDLLVTKT